MSSNLAGSSGNVQERQFLLQGTDLAASPNPFHIPKLPDAPSSPSAPDYPGTLNSFERAEVERYLATPTDAVLASLTLPDAIAIANAFKTYYADAAIIAWRSACFEASFAQRLLTRSDALIANKPATPISSDNTGSGGTPPPDHIPPGADTP